MSRMVIVLAGATLTAVALSRALKETDADIVLFSGDAETVSDESRARLLDALDALDAGGDAVRHIGFERYRDLAPAIADCIQSAPVAAADYGPRHSEAGQLRRDNRWREKQNNALINARMKQQKRR
jgi:hypothetical protein